MYKKKIATIVRIARTFVVRTPTLATSTPRGDQQPVATKWPRKTCLSYHLSSRQPPVRSGRLWDNPSTPFWKWSRRRHLAPTFLPPFRRLQGPKACIEGVVYQLKANYTRKTQSIRQLSVAESVHQFAIARVCWHIQQGCHNAFSLRPRPLVAYTRNYRILASASLKMVTW